MQDFLSSFTKYLKAYFGCIVSMVRAVVNVTRQLLDHKKIIIISNDKISSLPISSRTQAVVVVSAFILVQWVLYSSLKYFAYEEVLSQKDHEIFAASVDNEKWQLRVNDLNRNLAELDGYFNRLKQLDSTSKTGIFAGKNTSKDREGSVDVAAIQADLESPELQSEAKTTLFNIRDKVLERISSLENIIGITGLNVEKVSESNQGFKKSYDNVKRPVDNNPQGGPYVPVELDKEHSGLFDRDLFEREINYLSSLEEVVHQFPISVPMKDYWLSSRFGVRKDPIHNTPAMHYGLDFVGPKHSFIYSTGPGVVQKSGRYGAYGKFLEINHGNGITTRYGHLRQILVKKGDRVYRGRKIALQGNTGRSTGAHLHYEVRYNGRPLNPQHFLKAGKHVF